MYVKNGTKYTRRETQEGKNSGLVIVDIKLKHDYRIINMYQLFNPPAGETQRDFFRRQMALVKAALETLVRVCFFYLASLQNRAVVTS